MGLHSDEDITERRGPHLPLMDLHERSLSLLACKYVDEVIIGECLEPRNLSERLSPVCKSCLKAFFERPA